MQHKQAPPFAHTAANVVWQSCQALPVSMVLKLYEASIYDMFSGTSLLTDRGKANNAVSTHRQAQMLRSRVDESSAALPPLTNRVANLLWTTSLGNYGGSSCRYRSLGKLLRWSPNQRLTSEAGNFCRPYPPPLLSVYLAPSLPLSYTPPLSTIFYLALSLPHCSSPHHFYFVPPFLLRTAILVHLPMCLRRLHLRLPRNLQNIFYRARRCLKLSALLKKVKHLHPTAIKVTINGCRLYS